jgi:hypothetical protein
MVYRLTTLVIVLLAIMAFIVYYCEPLMACESQGQSDTGASDTGNSQSADAAEGNASSQAGAVGRSAGVDNSRSVDQVDNSGNGGNGPQVGNSWVDCDNPFWGVTKFCWDGE